MRLSVRLSEIYGISRRNAKKYISEKRVELNGKCITKDIEASTDDQPILNMNIPDPEQDPQSFIISKKDGVIFFYKPPFVHSERHTPEDETTISDLVPDNFNLISRLDYETDGIISAVEKNMLIKNIQKKYYAVVEGNFPEKLFMDNEIDAAKRKKVKLLQESGKNPVFFSLKEQFSGFSIVEATLQQAARHQLRAYLSHAGFPILGDKLYGGSKFPRLMLHCGYTSINDIEEVSNKYSVFLSYLKKSI